MLNRLPVINRLNLGPKFAVIFTALAVLGLAGFGYMVERLVTYRGDAQVINRAGRQRMLIERMAKETAEMSMPDFADTGAADDLRAAADEFERTLAGLLDGDAVLGLSALTGRDERAAAERVRAQWRPFRAAVDALLAAPDLEAQMQAAHFILTAEDSLLAEADGLVALLQAQSERRLSNLWQFGLLIGGLSVAVALAGWLLVERNVARPLRRLAGAAEEIAQGKLRAGDGLVVDSRDEIGRLVLAFRDMAEILDEAFAVMRESNRQLSALNAVGAAANESLNVDHVLGAALEAALSAVDLPAGFIALLTASDSAQSGGAGQRLAPRVGRGFLAGAAADFKPLALGESISGQVVAGGSPVVIADVLTDPSAAADPALRASGARAYASVPIKNKGRVLGVLNAAGREPQALAADDLHLLTSIGAAIGIAVDNALAYETIAQRAAELQVLAEVGGLVTAGGDLQSTLDALAEKVARAAGFEGVDIALHDPASDEVWFAALHTTALLGLLEGRKGARVPAAALPIYQQLLREGRPIALDDPQHDPRVRESQRELCRRDGVQFVAVLPLLFGDRVIGALDLISTRPHRLESEQGLLGLLASQVATAVENARLFKEADRRAQQLQALHAASRALSGLLDLNAVLRTLAESARQLVGARYGALAAYDQNGTPTHFATAGLTPEEEARIARRPSGRGLLGVPLGEGATLRLDDLTQDPRAAGFPPGHPPMKTLLAVPVAAHGTTFGMLYTTEKESGRLFTAEDEAMLVSLAADAALALENVQLFQDMTARLMELRTLFQVSESLARAPGLDETLQIVVELSHNSIPSVEKAVIHLIDRQQGLLVAQAVSGIASGRGIQPRLKIDEGIAGRAIRERRLVYVPDVRGDPDFVDTGSLIRSLVVVPLIIGEEVVGTLSVTGEETDAVSKTAPVYPAPNAEVLGTFSVDSARPRAFAEDSLSLLKSLGHQAAVAVKKAQITDDLRESLAIVELRSLDLETSLEQLRAAQEQVVQAGKLAALGTLSAGIAHELNNPLAGIKTYAQNLLRFQQKGRLTEPLLAENLTAIDGLVDKATRIIRLFRDFSRQSVGGFKPVNLNRCVADALSMLSEQLRLRDIAVTKDLAADLPEVRGDANQLEQVLVNLIGNARDAMAASARKELSLRTYRVNGSVVAEVSDTGSGIAPEHQGKIFDPFFTTKEVGEGTGLGLSISHSLVGRHGGRIEVESAPGAGTTFRVVLPIVAQTSEVSETSEV